MHPLSGTPDKSVAPTSTWPLVSRPKLHDARTSGFRPGTDLPPLATAIHRPRIDRDRAGPDLDDRPPLLFSMSPNRATAAGKSNFSGLSPVRAPDGWQAAICGGEPSRFAHGFAPTGEHLRGYFLVERNSFRFSRLLADLHHLTTTSRQRAKSTAGTGRIGHGGATHQTANLCSKLNCASLPRPQGRAGPHNLGDDSGRTSILNRFASLLAGG